MNDPENPWVTAGSKPAVPSTAPGSSSTRPAARATLARLLNLPTKGKGEGDRHLGPVQSAPPPAGVARAERGHHLPWATETESAGGRGFRMYLRAGTAVVVTLLALIGARELFLGDRGSQAPAVTQAGPTYPEQAASATAARFVTAYLTLDPEAVEQRRAQLAVDYAPGETDDLGWNREGRQSVLAVHPGAVKVISEDRAVVSVTALVQPFTATTKTVGDGPAAKQVQELIPAPPAWRTLEVPVAVVTDSGATRVVVTGLPGVVATTEAPAAGKAEELDNDSKLTSSTQDVAKAFFTAYAQGDVSPVVAPAAPVHAPAAGTVTLVEVTQWEVYVAEEDTENRTARAVVMWADPVTRAEFSQEYRLVLTPVSSSTGTRWQVADLHGGF